MEARSTPPLTQALNPSPASGPFQILFSNSDMVAIDKPAGFFVHRPSSSSAFSSGRRHFVPDSKIILSQLRRQVGQELFPVHRLDVATSGVLIFALSSAAAARIAESQREGLWRKTYHLVCRGWTQEGVIEIPLESDSSDKIVPASTTFRTQSRRSFPSPPAEKFPYPELRFSLVEAEPLTGRFHQIRRHFNRISHPILGDNDHGDSKQNRFFREQLQISGLCLRAVQMKIDSITIHAPIISPWDRIYSLFEI